MSNLYDIRHMSEPGEEVLRLENFRDGKHYTDVGFSLRKGEILGMFGLVGAGRSEVMRGLCGVDRRISGKIYLHGKETDIRSTKDALSAGIGFLTEDRAYRRGGAPAPHQAEHQYELLFDDCQRRVYQPQDRNRTEP